MTTEFTTNYQLSKPDFNLFGWHDDVNGNSDTIDAILFTLTGFSNFVGPWTNSTNYVEGQRVIDPDDATLWNCRVDHTSASTDAFIDDRVANPTYWNSVATVPFDRGEWASGEVYSVGDVAHSTPDGLFGVCNTHHTSTTSMRTDIANWSILFDSQDLTLASNIGFVPTGTIAATNVQAAIVEVNNEKQPLDADLTAIAALANTANNFIVGNGSAWVAQSGATARTSLGLGTADSPQFTGVNLGNASDTTLSRSSAGVLAVEGNIVPVVSYGTYTPVVTGSVSNPTITYTLQEGEYYKIGQLVFVNANVHFSAFSGGSGDFRVSLPFARLGSLSTPLAMGNTFLNAIDLTSVAEVFVACQGSAQYVYLLGMQTGTGTFTVPVAAFGATDGMAFSLTYIASS